MFASFFKELFHVGVYKKSQGLIVRRLTFLGLAIVFLCGAFCIVHDNMFAWNNTTTSLTNQTVVVTNHTVTYLMSLLTVVFGLWVSYRLVNMPVFADFLVSVEAEMSKVSWPSKEDLIATTKVVLFFMILFTVLIFFYDVILSQVFRWLNLVVCYVLGLPL